MLYFIILYRCHTKVYFLDVRLSYGQSNFWGLGSFSVQLTGLFHLKYIGKLQISYIILILESLMPTESFRPDGYLRPVLLIEIM